MPSYIQLEGCQLLRRVWIVLGLTNVPRIPHPGESVALPRLNLSPKTPCCRIDLVPHQTPSGLAPVITIPCLVISIEYPSEVGLPAASR